MEIVFRKYLETHKDEICKEYGLDGIYFHKNQVSVWGSNESRKKFRKNLEEDYYGNFVEDLSENRFLHNYKNKKMYNIHKVSVNIRFSVLTCYLLDDI